MEKQIAYEIFPLGDSAITIDLGNRICSGLNDKVLAMQAWIAAHPFDGLRETILGYSSLSLFYDPLIIHKKHKIKSSAFEFVKIRLEEAFNEMNYSAVDRREEVIIPVCYDEQFGSDLPFISETTHLNIEEIIDIHLSKQYRLYMIGFLPGFAYMGELDERIQVPRKQKPEAVVAGSVGIASGQTGIYPLDAPGGWHIIGRTPMKLFDPHDSNPVKLKPGQLVSFQRIGLSEFEQLSQPK